MGVARPRALGPGVLAALAALVAGAAVAQTFAPALRAMRWIAPGDDPAAVLAQAPPECLARPEDEAALERVLIGRAAFRTPVLLGGQAARAGLSCDSCHRNGRDNPHFMFPGVSGAAGTADVTSSLFSTHRGNGVDDPKPIPDLGGPKARLKVPQAPGDPALERFIRGLVVEEFDGPEPPPAVLDGLAAYVRALTPAQCDARGLTPLDQVMEVAHDAAEIAFVRLSEGDARTALFLISASRAQLGLVDERYVGQNLAPLRERVRALDRRLARAADEIRAGRGDSRELARTVQALRSLWPDLTDAEDRSLFNPQRLKAAANPRLQGKAS